MSKVICCIPVKGRRPLVQLTIRRLLTKNKAWKVICSGDDKEDEKVCRDAGAEWCYAPNHPLGRKWNRAYHAAEMYDPDYYMMMGSSDWVCDNWLDLVLTQMNGTSMAGTPGMYLLDNGNDGQRRLARWHGYTTPDRIDEPIGLGRIITAKAMERLHYTPLSGHLNSSMDRSMYDRVHMIGGKIGCIKDERLISLSISDYRWTNMHKFEEHWSDRIPSERIEEGVKDWLEKYFPEAFML